MLFRNALVSCCLVMALMPEELIAQANTLFTNGRIRVQGADWRDTRITVMPQFGEAFEVPLASDKFDLDLGLFSTYLIRAAHADCATKEIVFDLWVPDAYRNTVFYFPFEIMLETFPDGEKPYSYEHPVGVVFFDEAKADFTYTTDYTEIEQANSLPTMIERMNTYVNLHPKPVDQLAVYEALFAQDPNAAIPQGNTTPVDQTTSPSVRHTELPPDVKVEAPTTQRADPVAPVLGPQAAPREERPAKATSITTQPSVEEGTAVRSRSSSRISTRLEVPPPPQYLKTHEFSVLPTMLIVIDRFGHNNTSTELRKVTHAYGAVFYFLDGAAITERTYDEKLAEFTRPMKAGH
ncbi:MAG: hypothetical protein WBO28_10510 [Flavobacteriales bacterium]|jgi:hypothetical protein